ncbi:hypothetical protein OG552_26275 [Streptomyces sp. NBC_01476]|uniref:hypothetical protein n=1 Tax=Streptomyces sp. NBC_01476 TaxID=2903881 RepID=UPI002E37C28A|nr:hypothetical protein [Streptomyces sp. NBC_01476]
MGNFAWTVVGAAAGVLRLTTTRRDRKAAAVAAERVFPGGLRVVAARTLFPQTTGSEIVFAVTGDPDAVVRLRTAGGGREPDEAAVRAAVATGQAAAERWRTVNSAFAAAGYPVLGMSETLDTPWVTADLTAATLDEILTGLRSCTTSTGVSSVLIAPPEVARALPPEPAGLPTLLWATGRRRLAALSGRRPYHRLSYRPDGTPALGVVRPFHLQQTYEAAAMASAARWLAAELPGAEPVVLLGATPLLPGRLDRVKGYVVFRDAGDTPGSYGDHALLVTTDLDGALTGEPTVLRDRRQGTGRLDLPAL